MPRIIEKSVSEKYDGKKVIDFLIKELNCSHRLIAKLKKETEGITVNGKHIRTIDIIHTGDILSITMPAEKAESISVATKIPLDIIYEDDDLLVVNKQPMLAVHESHNHLGDTLSNAVAYHLEKEGKSSVFRAVGRLDKGTSGLMVCALNRYTASKLSGKIYKEYLAVANGVFEGSGTINEPIYRPDPIITVRKVDKRGEKAVTNWTAIKNDGKTTLLRIKLETGRTHQIRVHFSHIGAALIGDTMYGKPDSRIAHQALHCCFCRFTHPVTNEILEFETEPPEDFKSVIPE